MDSNNPTSNLNPSALPPIDGAPHCHLTEVDENHFLYTIVKSEFKIDYLNYEEADGAIHVYYEEDQHTTVEDQWQSFLFPRPAHSNCYLVHVIAGANRKKKTTSVIYEVPKPRP